MNYDPDMPAFLRRDWPEDQPKETDVAEPRNEPMTEVDDTAELAARIARTSASGDLRDLMLDEIKQHQARPWNERPEQDQHAIVNRVEAIAEAAVSRIVHIGAGDGRRTIAGMLEQFTTKDGIKATITFSATTTRSSPSTTRAAPPSWSSSPTRPRTSARASRRRSCPTSRRSLTRRRP